MGSLLWKPSGRIFSYVAQDEIQAGEIDWDGEIRYSLPCIKSKDLTCHWSQFVIFEALTTIHKTGFELLEPVKHLVGEGR